MVLSQNLSWFTGPIFINHVVLLTDRYRHAMVAYSSIVIITVVTRHTRRHGLYGCLNLQTIWYPSVVGIWYPSGWHMGPIWVCHAEARWGHGCKPYHFPDASHMAETYERHMGVIWLCYWGSNSIQQLSDHTLLFACYQKWPTGSARTHTDVSV